MMNIVLLEPEMPSNTGNIGRTCVATQTRLHLIEPLGFKLNEKALKRAGLDYWDKLDVTVYSDYKDFLERNPQASGNMYFATTKARKVYSDVTYGPDCYLMFGRESAGIPEEILVDNEDHCIRIPMWGDIRSLNLSNSAAIVLYEALRQNGFEKLELRGQLHYLHCAYVWDIHTSTTYKKLYNKRKSLIEEYNKQINETPPEQGNHI